MSSSGERWTPAWLDPYQEFLEITFGLSGLRFTSMVIDTQLLTGEEMKKYHEQGRAEAYLKFMRLLLSHRITHLVSLGHESFTLLYDKLSVNQELARSFRDVLKYDMESLAAGKGVPCRFEHLAQANSATLHLMQAADLLTGATWNAWMDPIDTSSKRLAREAVTDQIAAWAGADLTCENFFSTRYYSLWRWRPSQT